MLLTGRSPDAHILHAERPVSKLWQLLLKLRGVCIMTADQQQCECEDLQVEHEPSMSGTIFLRRQVGSGSRLSPSHSVRTYGRVSAATK